MKLYYIFYLSFILNFSYSFGFTFSRLHNLLPSNTLNKSNLFSNRLYYKRQKTNNIYARYLNNISRRNLISLTPIILKPDIVFSSVLNNNLNIKNVVVFGASGYTGGDTIRNLIEKDINVVAVTRRHVKIVNRENADKDTLVIDDLNKINKIKSVVADVLKPNTLENIMNNADAVIYCAASRPKVTARPIPGVELNKENNINFLNPDNYNELSDKTYYVEESNNVEDIGLVNVAKEAIKNNVKKLIIVSSICAKCQKNNKDFNGGEVTDKGETNCKVCYDKQEGEERVRLLYENSSPNLSYTIIRPGMLSPGEKRGVEEIEFNQGVSKSGIISRLDLADILVESTLTNNSNKKTFEVYYKDTAQPVDMYKSLKTCKEMGKSVKECFFGEDYKDDKKPLEIDKLLKNKMKGSIFLSGKEIIGDNYSKMLEKLKIDEKEYYDVNILKSNDIF